MSRYTSSSRGKLLAAVVLLLGVIAALAEWRFRPRPELKDATPAATTHP
jgi:hypothetical protein